MIAAGAIATVLGPNGPRQLPVEEVPAGPGELAWRPERFSSASPTRRGHLVPGMPISA